MLKAADDARHMHADDRARGSRPRLPKPLYGEAGSGMHFHQHPSRAAEPLPHPAGYGRSATWPGATSWAPPSRRGRRAFTNPSTNSYRRLIPGYEAPTSAIFSVANRSAAIRIPKYANRPETARFEFRPPDATCNPYLAIAAQLLAGIDGIRKGLYPTALGFGPVDEDIFLGWLSADQVVPPPDGVGRPRGGPRLPLEGNVFSVTSSSAGSRSAPRSAR
jgi:hypothetical protein